MKSARAFTLVELWVSLNQLQARALRTNCAANLRQIGQSLNTYASDNHGLLPDFTGADPRYARGGWPWNVDTNLINELERQGLHRAVYYCPANPALNDDRHWNFWRTLGSTRIISYGLLLKGVAVPREQWQTRLESAGTAPSQKTLGFDSTACIGDDYTRIQGLWTDRSNHLKDGQPLGGNLLFVDQHVAWRDFSQMQVRFQTPGPGGIIDWSY